MSSPAKRSFSYYFRVEFKTIQGKITTGFLLMGLFALSLVVYPVWVYQRIIDRYEQTLRATIPTEYYCEIIEVCLSKSNNSLNNYLLTGDDIYPRKRADIWENDFKMALDSLLRYTRTWENNLATSLVYDVSVKAGRLRAEQDYIERAHGEKLITAELFETMGSANRRQEVARLDLHAEDILRQLENIIEIQKLEVARAQKETADDRENLVYAMILLTLLVIFVAVVVAGYIITRVLGKVRNLKYKIRELAHGEIPDHIARTQDEIDSISEGINVISRNMRQLKEFATEVGRGNFEYDFQGFEGGGGPVGRALQQMRDSLKFVAEENGRRNWSISGFARFAQIMREAGNDLPVLCDNVLVELVKYVNANQGAIYVVDADDKFEHMRLMSWYAYDRKKFRTGRVEKGEGLVGEVYQEKQSMFITKLPEQYMAITSGLGGATPRCLFIVPLKVNEVVKGVLELASFEVFRPHEKEFIEKICESVASTLISLENNVKTQQLLETAQLTAEMMRAQEEEMRQNMEELQATQEELHRQRVELADFVNAINVSSILIEFDPTGMILQVNDRFCQLFQYHSAEVIGKPLSFYVPEDVLATGNIEEILSQIEQEAYFIRDVKRLKKDGTAVWLRAYYIPIRDQKGHIKKVSALCTDITNEVEAAWQTTQAIAVEREKASQVIRTQREMMQQQRQMFKDKEQKLLDRIAELEAARS